ncbi:class I SAM-dependent methyltransferase [Thermopolyspora sp. NPDC052614]|uniref:class I SAM-dependent methyltransferase n=1 Tax=Thermopolyspora sp. NPDC052614 TaxID=3155682 RepID=UPI003435E37E
MTTYYNEDLAHVHDAGYGDLARAAATALLPLLPSNAVVMDLGCGTGILAQRLSEAGHRVHGVDISPAAIALARSRAPRAVLQVASFADVPLPECDAVVSIGECLNYAFDPRVGTDSTLLPDLFARVRRALRPGGLLLFDVCLVGTEPRPRVACTEGDDWMAVVHAAESSGTLTRRITTFRRLGELWRRSDETHLQRLYTRDEITDALRRAGFTVRELASYGDHDLAPGRAGFLATLPEPRPGGQPGDG